MHDEAKLIFDACETSDLAKITDAFQHAVAEIDAAGPEHAVESVEELFAALRDVGMSGTISKSSPRTSVARLLPRFSEPLLRPGGPRGSSEKSKAQRKRGRRVE